MTKQVQRRRGTDTQHTGFTGAEGEISVNTTNKSVHVHDGSTAGGFEAARADLNNVTTANTASKLSGGTVSSLTVTSADINGGTIDGTTIGGSTPAAGSFTNVSVTGTVDGRDVATDGTKLDGIEASADITDTANVTAAGALMDSELTDIAAIKALNQGVATTDSPSFAGLTATTADINGGTIDGVTIGGASAGAGTFNALTVDGGTTNRVASFISTDANALIEFADDTTTNRPAIGAEGNDMTFSTNGEKVRIDSSGNVGIGTSPSKQLHILNTSSGSTATSPNHLRVEGNNSNYYDIGRDNAATGFLSFYGSQAGANGYIFGGANGERMRIDSSGNLLVGKTGTSATTDGLIVFGSGSGALGATTITRNSNRVLLLNRRTTDGDLLEFRKDNTKVGSIGCEGGHIHILGSGASPRGLKFVTNLYVRPCQSDGTVSDNQYDLGQSSARFNDVYSANGVTTTSDGNEKQDIEVLSDAEQRVAVACKGLLRKFRWKSAVEEKGDDARIHFGIIAQDLQAAFEAEGLDAGRYGMFMYNEWWETYTDVPAVEAVDAVYETVVIPAVTEERLVSEAVLDEEGNEIEAAVYETVVVEEETTEERLVSEAVEAKDAYTRTDTYETEEEAPEGAVKKSRMGVRYSELLAFIIAAI